MYNTVVSQISSVANRRLLLPLQHDIVLYDDIVLMI